MSETDKGKLLRFHGFQAGLPLSKVHLDNTKNYVSERMSHTQITVPKIFSVKNKSRL